VILRPGVIQYRIVGGTLDFTFFSGPSPTAVVQQYGAVSGFSQLPPTFALGFNLCRWGYKVSSSR
jgi:alpha-glucosidase